MAPLLKSPGSGGETPPLLTPRLSAKAGFYALQLARAVIRNDGATIEDLVIAIAQEFDLSDIKRIWHKAKTVLSPEEVDWLREQLRTDP